LLESEGMQSSRYKTAERWSWRLGVAVGIEVLMIIFLMVVKPPLWG
jgi:hypothetical protein